MLDAIFQYELLHIDELSFDKLSLDELNMDKLFFDKFSFYKLFSGRLNTDKLVFGELSVPTINHLMSCRKLAFDRTLSFVEMSKHLS